MALTSRMARFGKQIVLRLLTSSQTEHAEEEATPMESEQIKFKVPSFGTQERAGESDVTWKIARIQSSSSGTSCL